MKPIAVHDSYTRVQPLTKEAVMKRIALGVAAVALGVLVVAPAQAATPRLVGTVGPGYKITLTKGGKKVTRLKAGRYTFVIADKASIHDFMLQWQSSGPKQLTSVSFVGTKKVTLTLKKGRWKYYCAPHESSMFGFFTVT
jgi:plastocyanin